MTEDHNASAETRKTVHGGWKIALVALGIAAAAVAIRATGIADSLTIGHLRAFRESAGVWAPLAIVAVYAIGTIVAFPGSLLSLSCGLLFGTFGGFALILVGASSGAISAFYIARKGGRDVVQRFVSSEAIKRFDETVSEAGLSGVLFTRLVPFFPFNMLNFAWGLTGVRPSHYIIGTVFGIMPGAFVNANLAASVARQLEATDGSLSSINLSKLLTGDVLLAFALFGVLALMPVIIKAVRGKSGKS